MLHVKKIFFIALLFTLSKYSNQTPMHHGGYTNTPTNYAARVGGHSSSNIPKQCLNIDFAWNDLEYDFPNKKERENAISNGNYVAGNGVPIDVQPYYRKDGTLKVFTTIPRFTTGIPFSLAVVSSKRRGPDGPILKPYPSYEWHSSHGKDCDGITSVFRVAIDECHRLWVLDTGKIGSNQLCQPQLLVFDLNTNNLFHRYRFPTLQFNANSLFITPIVDVEDVPPRGFCEKVKVYIADVTGYGLLVYDSKLNTSWRVENDLMKAIDEFEKFTIAGESFTLGDGIFGLSVTPRSLCKNKRGCERFLYFHGLASNQENSVPLSIINDQWAWANGPKAQEEKFETIGTRDVQNAAMAIDKKGNLFSSPMSPIGISSWNIEKPYTTRTMKVENAETLQFISGMKIIKNKFEKEELWVNSCRFQKVMAGTIDKNEINFRIQHGLVTDILSGPC